MVKKRILCYGDSNMWGCSPTDGSRFDEDVRWPMVMASFLGEGYSVTEDARCGRTVLDLNSDPGLNAISWIGNVIEEYIPLSAAVICLGTNDVFDPGEIPVWKIISGLKMIIETIIEAHTVKKVPLPCMILLTPVMPAPDPDEAHFYELQLNKAAALIAEYTILARETGSLCLDISQVIKASEIDGAHLDRESHIKLGRIVAEFLSTVLL